MDWFLIHSTFLWLIIYPIFHLLNLVGIIVLRFLPTKYANIIKIIYTLFIYYCIASLIAVFTMFDSEFAVAAVRSNTIKIFYVWLFPISSIIAYIVAVLNRVFPLSVNGKRKTCRYNKQDKILLISSVALVIISVYYPKIMITPVTDYLSILVFLSNHIPGHSWLTYIYGFVYILWVMNYIFNLIRYRNNKSITQIENNHIESTDNIVAI